MPTQNLLMLQLLLTRIVLATICCRFRSWGLVKKLNFCSDFEHKVCQDFEDEVQASFAAGVWPVFFADVLLRLWSCILIEILKVSLVKILKLKFYEEVDVWLRFWNAWSRFWRWNLIKICIWTCLNFGNLNLLKVGSSFTTLQRLILVLISPDSFVCNSRGLLASPWVEPWHHLVIVLLICENNVVSCSRQSKFLPDKAAPDHFEQI